MLAQIDIPREAIARFCRDHGIRWMALFGSVLREDFDPRRSDLDILIEFEPGRTVGLITLAGYALELDGLLGRFVDLRTPQDISRYARDRILAGALTVYGDR